MSIILIRKEESTPATFFQDPADVAKAYELKDIFRRQIGDDEKAKNILDNQNFSFSDTQIYGFIKDAIGDINSGIPRTAYTIAGINDDIFVVRGAIVMALIARGILEVKNSLNYSDQGLSINTYDKGPNYQSWAGMISAQYTQSKMEYKNAEAYRNMFVGIGSDFGIINS